MTSLFRHVGAALLLFALTITASAEPTQVVLQAFDDDERSEGMAILNDEFSAAYPAGPRVTHALQQALTAQGYSLVEHSDSGMHLSGTVTAAYMMSRGLPTNSVAAHYQLVNLADGSVIASGDAKGNDWNNEDAAKRLAEAIIKKAFK